MKFKHHIQLLAGVLLIAGSLGLAAAQPMPPREPVRGAGAVVNPPAAPAPAIDPATGLPMTPVAAPAAPQWIDSNWVDPDIILTNVDFDNIPVSRVADELRRSFKGTFDILPMPKTYSQDWGGQTPLKLQLRNVKASEVFNAMNLVFENDRTPLRWELKASPFGNRSYAQLRVLPEAAPAEQAPAKLAETHRMVYYVGNLMGEGNHEGMTMEQIMKAMTDIWPAEFGKPESALQFHKEAQLVVVNGTAEQLEFVHQTLAALEQKAEAGRPKSADEKDIEELNSLIKSLRGLGAGGK